MIEFRDDDAGYFDSISANPGGFVLNLRRRIDPKYVVLHRAGCASISDQGRAPGAYTARGYRKVCARDLAELALAAKREGRRDGSFSKRCSRCVP